MPENFLVEFEAMAGRLVGWRREFHRRPETAGQEFQTSAALREFFEKLGLSVRGMAGTGLRADLE